MAPIFLAAFVRAALCKSKNPCYKIKIFRYVNIDAQTHLAHGTDGWMIDDRYR